MREKLVNHLPVDFVEILADLEKTGLFVGRKAPGYLVQTPQRLPQGNLQFLEARWVFLCVDFRRIESVRAPLRFIAILLEYGDRIGKPAFVDIFPDVAEFCFSELRHEFRLTNRIGLCVEARTKRRGPFIRQRRAEEECGD